MDGIEASGKVAVSKISKSQQLDSTIKNFKTVLKENSTNALQLSQKEIIGTLKIFKSFFLL